MERKAIQEKLFDILQSKDKMSLQIDTAKISANTSLLSDIALDSIQIIELIVGIENMFRFDIDTDELSLGCFDRFSDLIDFVQEKISGQKEAS